MPIQNKPRLQTENEEDLEMLNYKTTDKISGPGNCDNLNSKYPKWKENLSYYFSQFCGATSIHGVQYVGERGRLLVEKTIWITIITVVWCICIYLITKTYHKWKTSPVIVTFATTETPISTIPFPAISIYPEANSDPEIFNYTDVLIKKVFNKGATKEENDYFEMFSLICNGFYDTSEPGLKEKATIQLEDVEYLEKALPQQFKDNSFAMWQGHENEDDTILIQSVSEAGLGFSFNMLDYTEIFNNFNFTFKHQNGQKSTKWSLDNGYVGAASRDTFPKRSFKSGMSGGFAFIGTTNISHSKYSCNIPFTGYKVLLHHPCELPNLDKQIRLPFNQAVFIAIKPRMITISDSLKSYKSEDRKCFLQDERKLKYFRSYTQANCEQECVFNYTLTECHCLPFYLFGYDNIPICGTKKESCIEDIKLKYILSENMNKCDCLPSCTSLEYDVEISQTDLDFHTFTRLQTKLDLRNMDVELDTQQLYYSLLMVYYKETEFLTSERNELYGYVDFFSNTGGLLGLFIGFSVTSFIEILYFLTLRLSCNVKKFGKEFWSGAAELVDKYKPGRHS